MNTTFVFTEIPADYCETGEHFADPKNITKVNVGGGDAQQCHNCADRELVREFYGR